ncbi:MAG: hypothetical protein WDZ48_08670, partial [Pirellulales bacterium]
VTSMTSCGYFLGQIPWIRDHFEWVVIIIVLVSLLPLMIGALRHWRARRGAADESTGVPVAAQAGEANEP